MDEQELSRIPFADGHCDFLYGMVNYDYDIACPAKRQSVSLPALMEGNVKLQLFAAWVDMDMRKAAINQFMAMADAYERMLEENPNLVRLTHDFDPVGDKIAAVLTIEGGEAVEGYLENLRCFSRMGVRAMTLTWNNANELAHPALKSGKKGLTSLGREIVREMARINMAVDVSHLNDAGIDDVLAVSNVKVFASHSNARAVYNSPRALCDAHIKEIAARGGTIGVNFYHKQLSLDKNPSYEAVIPHIMHIIEVGGVNCAAIGSDFDGMDRYPSGLSSPADMPKLRTKLAESGLTFDELYSVCYGNLARFMLELC